MRLAILTTGRQDWDILRSTCRLLQADARFDVRLLAGGMHCSERYGRTINLIHEDGVRVDEALEWVVDGSDAIDEAAAALCKVGRAIQSRPLDALVLLGDRYETAAAALAATLARIPIVHLHGGEETQGAFDNALRHAITKLSHLHLVSHDDYAARVIAMGEPRSSVSVVGAPGLDNLFRRDLADRPELEEFLGMDLSQPVVLVTVHPATLALDVMADVNAVSEAMDLVDARYVVTLPNSDPGSEPIRATLLAACRRPGRVAVDALGSRRFWGLMRISSAMLGNSSSAVIEAPALGLPAVNVGDRQKGRRHAVSVVDVPPEASAIVQGLRRVLDPSFRAQPSLVDRSLLGDGHAAERVRDALLAWRIPRPPIKVSSWTTP